MTIDEERESDVAIVRPNGPLIGSDAVEFRRHLDAVMDEGLQAVVLDVTKVGMVDSRALETLADAADRLIRTGGVLKLCCVNPTVREVLELTELAPLFEQFDDVESAVRSAQ